MTEVIKEEDPKSPDKAQSVLSRGGVIIYPTETLYGIGALATDESPVEKVFDVKGRDYGKPIPVLVKDEKMISEFAHVSRQASILIRRFLPGSLTLILSQKKPLPAFITSGSGKVAVRISAHPFVMRLFSLLNQPITSTSANISGTENVFDFKTLYETFKDKVDLMVDSGNFSPSKGSTILDLTNEPPRVVREGDIELGKLREYVDL